MGGNKPEGGQVFIIVRCVGKSRLRPKTQVKRKESAGNLGRGQGILQVELMNNAKSLPSVARFGAFEVSFGLREIRKHGMRIQLEEKPFQILEALIENAGQVVGRKALCQRLWPDTYVAFDHSLNTAVNKLRSVLGDGAQSPRYIETRPRLGYRFVAPVEHVNGRAPAAARAASAPAGQSNISPAPQPQAHRVVMATAAPGSNRPQRAQV